MKRSAPKKPRNTSYHHGNLRTALIESGLELIEEKGIEALTLREIGARLGVSRTAAYRHFADKAALISAITESGFIAFGNALQSAIDTAAPGFASRMEAMGAAYIRFANEHRAYFNVMFSKHLEPGCAAREVADRAFHILLNTIIEGQRSGDVREGDPWGIAATVWAMVHGISTLHLDAAHPGLVAASAEWMRHGIVSAKSRQSNG